ncbi:MAG: tRNA lysidine(34) synthetase TilS [Bacteroidales bacterium]|nr:tRNA lysidine(34) synthetase TilS [Bacteroidales bacterium]MCF8403612.1 tRNA lysidine(34) synthetase TilS [Bacteroidales bacterium]
MKNRFLDFIASQDLFNDKDTILIGLSGGIDSMVMANLFFQTKKKIVIAHCNFQLRGFESDRDEKFVIDFCAQNNIPCFTRSFDTKDYAKINNLSIQMAARELRINWFEKLLEEHGFTYYATAHHLDDQIESFFINLLRGTGIAGLHGILPKQNKVIHPMLFTTRTEIAEYANLQNITFREDSSNSKTDYTRNKIRHQLLPVISQVNPDAKSIITDNIYRFRAIENIYQLKIKELEAKIVSKQGKNIRISFHELFSLPEKTTVLYEIIKQYGFNFAQATDITGSLESIAGKKFLSGTHQLIRDREYFIIEEISIDENDQNTYIISEGSPELKYPMEIEISIMENNSDLKISTAKNVASFDLQKITFPLQIRKWKKGDHFYPFGMKGKKLISDYFIDQKLSLYEKQKIWLLTSQGEILWVIGYRTDNRFKVSGSTKNIIRFTLKN